jgi:PhzF family phenazine biosynthesis protein
MQRRVRFVDVFGDKPMSGNPLAVVVDSHDLSSEQMQEIARWLNLSETTFLEEPTHEDADYRVRIFTLSGELPFAGHPTLGTCHVWADLAGEDKEQLVQECGAGLVRLAQIDGRLAFETPPLIRSGPVDPVELAGFGLVLGVDVSEIVASAWVDNGPGWVGIQLRDAQKVLELEPDFARHPEPKSLDIGVVGFHTPESDCLYEARAFFSDHTGRMLEDPVTGSFNASLADWLIGEGKAEPPYVASQGTALGRQGRVHVSRDDEGTIWIGGKTTTMVEGTLDF